jgi:hypothetical protein
MLGTERRVCADAGDNPCPSGAEMASTPIAVWVSQVIVNEQSIVVIVLHDEYARYS